MYMYEGTEYVLYEMRAKAAKILPKHEEILSNLKVKLKNHARFTSLKIMSARKVADYLPTYAKQGMTKLSSVLPQTLCSLVYQEFMEPNKDKFNLSSMRSDCREFNADLHEKLLVFAGDGLLDEEFDCQILKLQRKLTDGHKQFFEKLAARSPTLKNLVDNVNLDDPFKEFQDTLLLTDYYSLRTMSNLEVLELQLYPVKEADLKFIGNNLPLLQRLRLNFGDCKFPIEGGLKSLTNLKFLHRLFLKVNSARSPESIQLMKNCMLLMPQVTTVASQGNYGYIPHDFSSFKGPVELGVVHLILDEKSVIPSNVSLPHVTKITAKTLNIPLKQFKKLEDITFTPANWLHLERVLSEVGHRLKKLKISYVKCWLARVLQLCPNLEELHLVSVEFVDNLRAYQLKDCIRSLKRFKHQTDFMSEEDFVNCPGLLHLLLTSCPDLEELLFAGIILSKAEIDLIAKDMETGGLAIEKLQKVKFEVDKEDDANVTFANFAGKLFLENYKIFKKVGINESFNEGSSLHEWNLALKMQYYVQNKHEFRNNSDF